MTTTTWKSGASGNWDIAGDWTTGIPGASDNAVIDGSVYINDTTGPVDVGSIRDEGYIQINSPPSATQKTIVTVEKGVFLDGRQMIIDNDANDTAAFGSTVTIKGKVTNDYGDLSLGSSGNAASYATTVTIGSYNANFQAHSGELTVFGGTSGTGDQTTLDIESAAGFGAAGIVYGTTVISGNALIDFKSGGLTTVAAYGSIELLGPNAFVAVGGQTNFDSALTKLQEIDGNLELGSGAKLTTTVGMTLTGSISLDTGTYGGSRLYIGGTLSNNVGTITVGDGSDVAGVDTILNVGAYANAQTTGFPARLFIAGGANARSIMYDRSAAGFGRVGIVDGAVTLSGNALIDFKSGTLTMIAADGSLSLSGAHAFVASGSATTTDSAMTGLDDVAGTFDLQDGATFTYVGKQFYNSGGVTITTRGDGVSAMTVKGALNNAGTITVTSQTSTTTGRLTVTGATYGKGTIVLSNKADVVLSGGILAGQTLGFTGSDDLAIIGNASNSTFAVTGFAAGDTVDLRGEVVKKLSYNGTTLTLTLSNGATQKIAFSGSATSLHFGSDGVNGTNITAATGSPMTVADMGHDHFAPSADLASLVQALHETPGTASTTSQAPAHGPVDYMALLTASPHG